MDRALTTLEEIGAINDAGTLTALGKHMVSFFFFGVQYMLYAFPHEYLFILQSMLPLDIRLAKVIIPTSPSYLITYVK